MYLSLANTEERLQQLLILLFTAVQALEFPQGELKQKGENVLHVQLKLAWPVLV